MVNKKDYALILEAIEKINDEVYSKQPNWEYRVFCTTISCNVIPKSTKYSTLGYIEIKINTGIHSITIFNSDEDDRRYNELEDKYESWYKYIRRKWKITREHFYKISL